MSAGAMVRLEGGGSVRSGGRVRIGRRGHGEAGGTGPVRSGRQGHGELDPAARAMAMLEGRGQGPSGHGEAGFGCRVEAWRGWIFDWILMQGRGPREGGALDFGRFTGERLHGFDVAVVLTQGQTGGWIREAEFGINHCTPTQIRCNSSISFYF